MALEDLQKQLYKKPGQAETQEEVTGPSVSLPPQKLVPTGWGEEQSDFLLQRKKRRIFWGAVALVFLAAAVLVGWFLWRSTHSFDTQNVALEIFGQERIVGGEEVNFAVRYKNNTKVVLENAVLTFIYSEDSLPDESDLKSLGDLVLSERNLGSLAPGQEGQAEFKAKVLGDKDSAQNFSAKLNYQPANFKSEFSNEAEFKSTIVAVPIVLNFDLPEKIVSGQDLSLSLHYINTSDTDFSGLKIKINWPADFVFSSAFPAPAEGKNIWNLNNLSSHQENKIAFNGVLSGSEGDDKVFQAQIGVERNGQFVIYSQTVQSTLISASPLSAEQSLTGADSASANLGQTLNYNLKYRNTTDVPLGPITVKVKIESRAVDWNFVNAPNGFFDSNADTITWDNSNWPSLKNLEGKGEGELRFSFKIKDQLPVSNFSDKNFSVLTTTSIDSSNVPLELAGTKLGSENKLTVKINSRVVFNQKGYYQDSLISNSGPLPPRVGQETTYTIHWYILNVSNDISETEVSAILPVWIQWKGKISPTTDNSLKYDASSRQITWHVGNLAAGTGVLTLVKQVAFQVGFIPSLSQVGNSPEIIKDAKLEARDNFTSVPVLVSAPDLTTALSDDPSIDYSEGKVVN